MQSGETTKRASNFKDLTKEPPFDRLTVKYLVGRRGDGLLVWRCVCDCGNEVDVVGKQLTRGQTRSCGCLLIERTKAANSTHGMKGTRVYRIWSGMWNRCRNPNSKDYPRYGGRGISICDRWCSFDAFYEDMGDPPTDTHSIDRFPDTNGNYEKDNCRWATAKQQANNRRKARPPKTTPEVVDSIRELLASGISNQEIALRLGLNRSTVRRAINREARTDDAG